MLNTLWAGMLLLGILYAALTGRITEITDAALSGAGDAVSLCITMAGVMALWMGFMEIACQSGLLQKLSRLLRPFLRFLFPRIPPGHPANEYISANLTANLLGLGWACTPAGLKAMEALAQLEAERGNPQYLTKPHTALRTADRDTRAARPGPAAPEPSVRAASNEMCIFLILNISSLQLIPVNMIAYRSQYGSLQPAAVTAPALLATAVSTAAAVLFCKLLDRPPRSAHTACYEQSAHTGRRSS